MTEGQIHAENGQSKEAATNPIGISNLIHLQTKPEALSHVVDLALLAVPRMPAARMHTKVLMRLQLTAQLAAPMRLWDNSICNNYSC